MAYGAKGRTKEFSVFDCDSHIYEPPEIWDKYIPQKQSRFREDAFLSRRGPAVLGAQREDQFQRSRQVEIPRRNLASGSDEEDNR